MTELNKSDYEDITFLLRIGKFIQEDYEQLYQLEIEGKKNTKEYQDTVTHLQSSSALEENTFGRLSHSFGKAMAVIEWLKKQAKNDFSIGSLDFNMDKEKQVLFRYLNKFTLVCMQNQEGLKEQILDEKTKNAIGENNPEIEAFILKNSFLLMNFSSYLSNDIIRLVMAINEEKRNTLTNPELNQQFIRIKYFFSFIFKDMEKDIIKNDFEINRNPYLLLDGLLSLYHVPVEKFQKLKDLFCHKMALEQITGMLCYDDYELIKDSNMCNAIIRQSFVRAFLIMMSQEEKMQLKKEIEEILSLPLFKDGSFKFRIGNGLIQEIFTTMEKDKEIPKIITIKLK